MLDEVKHVLVQFIVIGLYTRGYASNFICWTFIKLSFSFGPKTRLSACIFYNKLFEIRYYTMEHMVSNEKFRHTWGQNGSVI